jgi:hypothetical protein
VSFITALGAARVGLLFADLVAFQKRASFIFVVGIYFLS